MNLFKHPRQVCMTYFEHFKLSMNFSMLFFYAGFAAVIHAFIPDLHIHTTSETVDKIKNILSEKGCRDSKKDEKLE